MESPINGENQRSSENLRIFNENVALHTSYQTQCFINEEENLDEMIDSTCSSPYVSAPSSPGGSNRDYNNNNGYFFSAPASPMHYIQSKSISVSSSTVNISSSGSFEFDFSSKSNSISTADELFLNGQIRPMKLSSHLQKPQILTPLIDLENEVEEEDEESVFLKREGRLRNGSIHRRARSLSPLRSSQSQWHRQEEKEENKQTHSVEEDDEEESSTTTPSDSASTSRSSSTSSRSSKRWVFLKDFLRSKSEGRGIYSKEKFWNSISFNPVKDKKQSVSSIPVTNEKEKTVTATTEKKKSSVPAKKTVRPINGIGKRRVPGPSAHEMLYTSNRAQAEEMKRKTYLPYRQGLLGCLGFSSKGYGAMNVFARSLNTTVSSSSTMCASVSFRVA
ncbi:uncharacterized protein LOC113346869 [Papaver somniferum]|uniref:uncharacterized protein LOC113346869 n=1 Tax=Papaver somniferum TaxID=3469 RepID=UPI000E701AE2|nr:uncharacterized protein LOC113346869 [Papaver somniferum]